MSFVRSGKATRVRSRSPDSSNRQSSTFSACAENNAKFVPRRSAIAPSGYGVPADTRIHASRTRKTAASGGTTRRKTCRASSVELISDQALIAFATTLTQPSEHAVVDIIEDQPLEPRAVAIALVQGRRCAIERIEI